MYLFKIGLLHNSFNNMFLMMNQMYNHNTRNKHSFHTTSRRTKVRQFSFQYQGPKFKIQPVLLYLIQIWQKFLLS